MLNVNCEEGMLSGRPDAVLIDLDHTIYDYDRPHSVALAEVRNKLHRSAGISPERFTQLYESARRDVKEALRESASAHSRLLYFQRLIEIAGMRSDVVMALDCEQTYWRTFLSAAKLFPHVAEILRLIRSIGVPIAVVTDLTAQIQFRKIVYFGLESVIDHVVTSEEAGADKPSPRIFGLARRKLDLPSDARVWSVGDDLDKDCLGPREHLGAVTFLRKAKNDAAALARADVAFESFDDLMPLFERFSG